MEIEQDLAGSRMQVEFGRAPLVIVRVKSAGRQTPATRAR